MIEDKRRRDGNDFDFDGRDNSIERNLISPISMGEMLDDDALDQLCDVTLTDLANPAAAPTEKG